MVGLEEVRIFRMTNDELRNFASFVIRLFAIRLFAIQKSLPLKTRGGEFQGTDF